MVEFNESYNKHNQYLRLFKINFHVTIDSAYETFENSVKSSYDKIRYKLETYTKENLIDLIINNLEEID